MTPSTAPPPIAPPGPRPGAPDEPPAPPRRYRAEAASQIAGAMTGNGVDFAVMLPDSVLHAVNHLLARQPGVTVVHCAREDEGVATAMGAAFAGRRPAVLMEGSGIGYAGLALARAAAVNRAEVLLVVGHTPVLGERFHYHAATLACLGILDALGIPSCVLPDAGQAGLVFREIMKTMSGQRTPVAVLVPRYVTLKDQAES